MGIILDSREPTKFRRLFIAAGLKHEIKQMITGDVLVYNDAEPEHQILIERKRLDDLVSGFYGDRMAQQFQRMSEEKFAILVITGNLQDVIKKIPFRVMSQIVEEVIASAVVQYNFRSVVWMIDGVSDVHQAGFIMMTKIVQKIVSGLLDVVPEKKIKLDKDLRVNSLRQIFGIDANTAKNLLKKHDTVRDVLLLSDSQFLETKGIGQVKLRTIRFILDQSFNSKKIKSTKTINTKKCKKCDSDMSLVKMVSGNAYICRKCIGSL